MYNVIKAYLLIERVYIIGGLTYAFSHKGLKLFNLKYLCDASFVVIKREAYLSCTRFLNLAGSLCINSCDSSYDIYNKYIYFLIIEQTSFYAKCFFIIGVLVVLGDNNVIIAQKYPRCIATPKVT